MVEKLVVYQKRNNFVLTRLRQEQVLDAEEFLHNLEASREQLKQTKKDLGDFERDIKLMEKLEPLAKEMRDKEVQSGKKERQTLQHTS